MRDLSKLSIVIATHVYAIGPSFKLEKYLSVKVKRLIFIGHPFSFAQDTRSFIRVYEGGTLILEKKIFDWKWPGFLFYFKDLFLTIWWCLKYNKSNDYFIGVDNFNVLSGYLLNLFGNVKKIIFYTIDYVPQRFDNKIMNSVYHWLDRLAIAKSYRVWNLSSIMAYQRERRGVDSIYRTKQIVVPIGTDLTSKLMSFKKIDRNKIVFMGHLREGQGVEMLIHAMKEVIAKVSKAHLLIIGGGPLENELKKQVHALGMTQEIKFSGFVKNYSAVQKLLRDAAIAVAPYVDDKKTFTRYTDPGKPKDYLAEGLPVVITKVPQIAFEIENEKCGYAIDYDKEQLTKALIKLLSDDKTLGFFRKNAYKMAEKYVWDKVFDKAFSETL